MDDNVNDINYCSALCIFRKRNFKAGQTVDSIAGNLFLKYNECIVMNMKVFSSVILIAIIVSFIPGLMSAEDDTATLQVVISNIKSQQQGSIIAVLYKGKENWLRKSKEYQIKKITLAGQSEITVSFEALAQAQDYALFVFHDANDNETLDFRIFPIPRPREGVGVSNDAVRFGKPLYDKAQFSVEAKEKAIAIRMHY